MRGALCTKTSNLGVPRDYMYYCFPTVQDLGFECSFAPAYVRSVSSLVECAAEGQNKELQLELYGIEKEICTLRCSCTQCESRTQKLEGGELKIGSDTVP